MRKERPSFVAEFPLRTDTAVERVLAVRMEAARHVYNTCLQESLRRLKLMRESKDWQRARGMPRHIGKDKDGNPIANSERRDLFKKVTARYGFTSAEIQKHAEKCRDACWIGEHLGSHDTQTTSLRAFKAVQLYAFGKRGRPRFKGRNRLHSVEGKQNYVLRYKDGVVHWADLCIPVIFDARDKDKWQEQALAAKLKYVRIVRRRIQGRDRWYAQLVMHGYPPVKAKHVLGHGAVAFDIGPSTIATVSATYANLRTFCPTVDDLSAEIRLIQRAMDRSLRAMNLDNYNPDGTTKKGARTWKYSRGYKELKDELADKLRCLASERKRSHGEETNRALALGDHFKMEDVSYKGWQRSRYGRSIGRRAPGTFVSQLKRKAGRAGAEVEMIDTRKTRLSQFDHKTGEYKKKRLSERWHVFPDGSRVQRDLYSAWLALHVDTNSLDASLPVLEERFLGAEPLLWQAASRYLQSASGHGSPSPSGRMGSTESIAVGADRLPKAGGRRTGRCSKRTRPGVKAGQAVARGPHPRERSGEIALDTARIPRL